MSGKLVQLPVKDLKLARNLRSDPSDEAALRADWRSYRKEPGHPILINSKKEVIDGNRRVMGAMLEGDGDVVVDCLIVEGDDRMKEARIQFATATHRAALPLFDQCAAMAYFRDASPGKTLTQLAEDLDIEPSMPSKLLSFERCIPEVQEQIKAGKIGLRDMVVIAALTDPDEQRALLDIKRGGASVSALQAESKKRRKKATAAPAVRTSKIKCPLPSGVTVQVAGGEVSLEEAIEAAGEAIKLMKQAVAKGLNAKTAMNVWKDVAAAG